MAEGIGEPGESGRTMLSSLAGCRTRKKGSPGASQCLTSPQLSPQEKTTPESGLLGPHRGSLGLVPEYRGGEIRQGTVQAPERGPATARGTDQEDTLEALLMDTGFVAPWM